MLCNLIMKIPRPATALNIQSSVYIVTRDDKMCSLNFVTELLFSRFKGIITVEYVESSWNRSCVRIS